MAAPGRFPSHLWPPGFGRHQPNRPLHLLVAGTPQRHLPRLVPRRLNTHLSQVIGMKPVCALRHRHDVSIGRNRVMGEPVDSVVFHPHFSHFNLGKTSNSSLKFSGIGAL
jgi:hypothetical protein